MKRGLLAFHPLQVGAFRILLAFLSLIPFMFWIPLKLHTLTWKEWRSLMIVGFFGNGIPALLFPLAETQLNSASVGVLNAMTPLSVLTIGALFFSLAFTQRQFVGLTIGLSGSFILIAMGGEDINLLDKFSFGSLVLLATVCYGLSTNTMKKHLHHFHPIRLSIIVLGISSIPYLIYLLITAPPGFLSSPGEWTALFYLSLLGMVGTAFATVLFHRLLTLTHPVFAASVTYLIPLVALMWGLLDGELINPYQFIGVAIIIGGVYISNK